ncbi:MAG: hypothetical protein KatS3mg002_0192 [Candidatus Woesearchaeota archaeon]|nr:MAG: hypothetical protein KatS3mg002_0192 [Candidatus Woesearchaeota archaeon]
MKYGYIGKTIVTLFFSAHIFTQSNIKQANTEIITELNKGIIINNTSNKNLEEKIESSNFPIRVLIDPGHGPYDGITKIYGTRDPSRNLTEFDMTYKLSEKLKRELEKDERFEVQMTKNIYGYDEKFIEFCNNNKNIIEKLYPPGKLVFHNDLKHAKIISNKDPKRTSDDWKKLYAISLYSKEFDIFISPHFDYYLRLNKNSGFNNEYLDSGYTIIINPYSKKFEETKKFAEIISEELSKIRNVTTNPIMNSINPKRHRKNMKNSLKELNNKGIALRNLVVLGKEKGTNIAVLIEYDHLRKVDTSQVFINKAVDATIRSIYRFKNLEQITKKDY